MSARGRVGMTAAVAAGAAGTAVAATRIAARHIRAEPDGDASRALEAETRGLVSHQLDTYDRGRIHVVERGSELDPPIVLSHGVMLSVRTWFYQFEALPKEGFRTIAYDHRGHGQSILGEAGHSVENLGRDMKTVLEGLDLRGAVLVGHSMGGVAVQSFVTSFPDVAAERVAGIVLLSTLAHTPFGTSSTRTKARMERVMDWSPNAQRFWDARNLGFLATRVVFGPHPHPSHVELTRRMLSECPHETRRDASRALVGLDLTPSLPGVRIPTLVIVGSADVLTPPAEARRIAALIPGARLEVMEGGGHMLMFERTDALNRLIVDFARSVRT